MSISVRGKVTGVKGFGIPNLRIELWEADLKGHSRGNNPLALTITESVGDFALVARSIKEIAEIPEQTVVVVLDQQGVEIFRKPLARENLIKELMLRTL